MTVMTVTTMARMLLSGPIDEVDDAGSRAGIARTVRSPRTEKRRYLAGRRCTPAGPTCEGESIGKNSTLPVCVMSQCDLCLDAVIDKKMGGLCCRYQCQRQHDSEDGEEVSECHWPPSGRNKRLRKGRNPRDAAGIRAVLRLPPLSPGLSAHAYAAVNLPNGGRRSLEIDYFRAAASFTESGTANPSSVR